MDGAGYLFNLAHFVLPSTRSRSHPLDIQLSHSILILITVFRFCVLSELSGPSALGRISPPFAAFLSHRATVAAMLPS